MYRSVHSIRRPFDVEIEERLSECTDAHGLGWFLALKELSALTIVTEKDLKKYADPDTVKSRPVHARGVIVHTYKRYTPYFFLFRADNSWTSLPNWVPRTAMAQLTVSRLFKEFYLRGFDNLVAELCRCARDQLNVESCLAETVLGLPPHSFVNPASRPTQRAIARRFLELTDYLPTPDARQEGDKGKGPPVLPSASDIPGDESDDDDDGAFHFHPHPRAPRAPGRLYDT